MSQFAMQLALPNERKLHSIDEAGQEVYKSVEDSRSLQLLRLQTEPPPSAEPTAKQADESQPDPRAVLQCLESAKGDLDVIRDLINNIKDQRYMGVQTMEVGSNEARLRLLVPELVLKLGRKQGALRAASQRLREGASALRQLQKREDDYFDDLAKLQRFWKVQHSSHHPECPFLVDLSLNRDMREQLPRGLAAVELYKDAACRLRVQLPKGLPAPSLLQQQQQQAQPAEAAVVGVGAGEVHALLKERQQKLLSHLLDTHLLRLMPHAGPNAFLTKLSSPAIHSTEGDGVQMRAMQVLVRDFCYHHYWRSQGGKVGGIPTGIAPPPPPLARVVEGTRSLLQDLAFWQSHDSFRRFVRHHLELQALQLGAKLHWTPAWHKLTSALRVEVSPGHYVTILVQRDSVVEVEGAPAPQDCTPHPALHSRLRLAREVGRAEVPTLLLDMLQGRK